MVQSRALGGKLAVAAAAAVVTFGAILAARSAMRPAQSALPPPAEAPKTFVQPVIQPVPAAAPAAHKEQSTMATVKRKGNKVRIEGVPPLGWGKGIECTYAGALASALKVTPHPYSYDDIMGLSGLAFRVRWFQGNPGQQRWCPSSPVGEFPEPMDATQKATGWRFRVIVELDNPKPEMAKYAPDVVRFIDAGLPVVSYDSTLNMGVVYGYEDGGAKLTCLHYVKRATPVTVLAGELGPMAIFLTGHDAPLAPREALVESLRIVSRYWKEESEPSPKGRYWLGKAALGKWSEDIGAAGALDQKDREFLFFVSWWNFSSLMDARAAAVRYLRSRAGLLSPGGREALLRAAKLYEEEGRLFGQVFADKNAFLGPWSDKKIEDWTDAVRAREREVLAQAARLERRAEDGLDDALFWADEVAGQVRPVALEELAVRNLIPHEVHYLGAGVPVAIVHALKQAGTDISVDEFTAATGWAFSFGYGYDKLSTAFLAVCGKPGRDGPYEVFRWLTERLGYTFEGVPVRDTNRLWDFVKQNVDAGRLVLSEQLDGGLMYGYRQKDGEREVWFGGPVGRGWYKPGRLQPAWVYILKPQGQAVEKQQLIREALARALKKALPHEHDGVPQGLAALEAYRKDVADPAKNFDKRGEWFCWATFERLMARKSCAAWLRSAAGALGGPAREPLLAAAGHYAKAFEGYDKYRAATGAGEADSRSLQERTRAPERIAVLLPLLDEAIADERAGVEEMRKALAALGIDN